MCGISKNIKVKTVGFLSLIGIRDYLRTTNRALNGFCVL